MSYILDALKKSEQERGHGNIPGVQTVHSSSLNYRKEKNVYWPYVLISAVIINIALVLYFIFDKDPVVTSQMETASNAAITSSHEIDTTEQQTAATAGTIITGNNDIEPQEVTEQGEVEIINSEPAQAMAHEETASATDIRGESKTIAVRETKHSNTTTEDDATIIDFYNLPDSIKQQLPAIIVSAHVYSSNPLQRSIVINNNFMEEGEYVLDNLRLDEITATGAIFDYNGTRFSYSVISSWQ